MSSKTNEMVGDYRISVATCNEMVIDYRTKDLIVCHMTLLSLITILLDLVFFTLNLINDYLVNRDGRTKINDCYSSYSGILLISCIFNPLNVFYIFKWFVRYGQIYINIASYGDG